VSPVMVALDRDEEGGKVTVADDLPELPFGFVLHLLADRLQRPAVARRHSLTRELQRGMIVETEHDHFGIVRAGNSGKGRGAEGASPAGSPPERRRRLLLCREGALGKTDPWIADA